MQRPEPNAYFVISSWKNDISWVNDYTSRYTIYDKSHDLAGKGYHTIIQPDNVGYNGWDICHFISENYEYLPVLLAFVEGNPFDHCKKETFDKLIYNNFFTPLEDYSHVPESYAHRKDEDGGYLEINNSWYIQAHIQTHGPEVNRHFQNYNDFLDEMFENPEHPEWVRFSPGAQYIVPKKNIMYYSKDFYKKIMGYIDYHQIPSESHIVERAFWYIFTNKWEERK